METIIDILLIIVIIYIIKVIFIYSDFSDAKKLKFYYFHWGNNGFKDKDRPSGSLMRHLLYRIKNRKLLHKYVLNNPVDIIDSFPTKLKEYLPMQTGLVYFIYDHFLDVYNHRFNLAYIIRFVISIPSIFIDYIGGKRYPKVERVLNILIWIIIVILLILHPFKILSIMGYPK